MCFSIIAELLDRVTELREIVSRMKARGERVPFEAEEALHHIEEAVKELAASTTMQ